MLLLFLLLEQNKEVVWPAWDGFFVWFPDHQVLRRQSVNASCSIEWVSLTRSVLSWEIPFNCIEILWYRYGDCKREALGKTKCHQKSSSHLGWGISSSEITPQTSHFWMGFAKQPAQPAEPPDENV